MLKRFLAILLSLTAVVMLSFSFVGCNNNHNESTDMAVKIARTGGGAKRVDFILEANTSELRMTLSKSTSEWSFRIDKVGIRNDKKEDTDLYSEVKRYLYYDWFEWNKFYAPEDEMKCELQQDISFTNPNGEKIQHKEAISDSGEYEITWKIKFVKGENVYEKTVKIYLTILKYTSL